jgi:hypothetical protein
VVGLCRSIVALFHKSAKKTAALRAIFAKVNPKSHASVLIGDVATRWNSIYSLLKCNVYLIYFIVMMQRIYLFKDALIMYLSDPENKKHWDLLPNPKQWDLMLELINVLEHFQFATTKLEAEQSCTISEVLPTLHTLRNVILGVSSDNEVSTMAI